MTQAELDDLGQQLRNNWPLIGNQRRRKACKQLAAARIPDTIPLLVEALASKDQETAAIATDALRSLDRPDAADALCQIWADRREEPLGQLITEKQYVATTPVKVRVLSALKAGAPTKAAETREALPHLIEALNDRDAEVMMGARRALRGVTHPDLVDALCALWVETRNEAIGTVIAEKQYVATKPLKVRVLSALKANKAELVQDDEGCVNEVAGALGDADAQVATHAAMALSAVSNRRVIDALCRLAMEEPKGRLVGVLAQAKKEPSDPKARALFLFVTAQLDRYFQDDHEFQQLRPAYEEASDKLKRAVLDVVRSGDRRCLGFYTMRPKPLADCNDNEIRTAIDSAVHHKDWRLLFQMFLELPMRYGYPLLSQFQTSGWSPTEPDLASLYREALKFSKAEPHVPTANVGSSVFEKWLSQGSTLSGVATSELIGKLDQAGPPDAAVKTVAALSQRRDLPAGTADKIRQNPDWFIRMAGYMTGMVQDLSAAANDTNHWIRELAGGVTVLNLWPARATPADLQGLKEAPPEAFLGRLGSVRRVLQLLVAYRMTAPVMEPVMIEAAEDAGVFERAK